MSDKEIEQSGKKPSFILALVVIIVAVALILSAVIVYDTDVHIPLVLSACIAALISMFVLKVKWPVIEDGILNSILMAMQAVLILYTVGSLIGIWIRSGVVPTMIYS